MHLESEFFGPDLYFYFRPHYQELLSYLLENTNLILYTSIKKQIFKDLISKIDQLKPFQESENLLCGYLYHESMVIIEEDSIPFKDVAKIFQFPEINLSKTVMIDHRFPSLFFAKTNALPVFEYIASDDNDHSEKSLPWIMDILRE